MEKKKTVSKKKKESDYFVRLTVMQFLVCGFFVLLVFGACRLSPDGGAAVKAKYNEIMLTDISFVQVWSSVKEVAHYVMKPIEVDSVQESITQPDSLPKEDADEKTMQQEEELTTRNEKDADQNIQSVMSFFGDSGKITPPAHGRITSYFGERTHPISGDEEIHKAVDIAMDEGTCVAAAWDGIVTETGYDAKKGNYLWLVHKNGNETFYCHLSEILVNDDAVIRAGETIAFSGNTGRSTGPHLHFAIKENGEYVNPLNYLSEKDGGI